MEKRNNGKKEVLCFTCGGINYGVEMQEVAEICTGIKVYPIPRLPDYLCGVFSYKGNILPIVRISPSLDQEDTCEVMIPILLVVHSPLELMGIRLESQPWIGEITEENRTEQFSDGLLAEGWVEQGAYRVGEQLLFLLDIAKSSENLTAFQK